MIYPCMVSHFADPGAGAQIMSQEVLDEPELDFNEVLRMEFGWKDVSSGLSRVLMGYATLFLGTLLGFGLVAMALYGIGDDVSRRGGKPSLTTLWELYLGLGILSVVGLISYVI